mgnify:CR=1 FL=1
MDTFTTIVIGLIVLFFFIDGIRRGLVRQVFEIVGLVAAFVGAYYLGHALAAHFEGSTRISSRIVFWFFAAAVFLVVVVVFHLLGRIFQKIMSVTVLSPVDKIGGAVFGALKGVLFTSLLCVIAYNVPLPGTFRETLATNRAVAVVYPVLPRVYNFIMKHSVSRPDGSLEIPADGTRNAV